MQILDALDRHDEVIKWANAYERDKKLDRVAKRYRGSSEEIKAHLAFHKLETRHIDNDEEIDEKDLKQEELVAEEEDENE